jgi:enoyl-CoA hydratase/carnithine racemase
VQERVAASRKASTGEALVLIERPEPAIAILTLNRPGPRNSLSLAMLDALLARIAEVSADQGVHAVVLAANGPAFCAGHDLKELTAARAEADRGRAFFKLTMDRCATTMQAIMASPKPFIAAVHGTATAAGCQLVATCDLAVAAETASFATPGVNIGLFCSTPMVPLSRNVAPKHAMEMLLTGEPIAAKEAWRMGLVNRVVSPNELAGAVDVLAKQIAGKSTLTVKTGKQAFQQQRGMNVEDAYAFAAAIMTENLLAQDAEEGIGAFIEKRRPQWKDR